MNSDILKIKLDITMTATLSPEIIKVTLNSFYKKFLYQFEQTRLIINIDPIGDGNVTPQDILTICKKYFNEIIYNTSSEPSFPKAVKWCLENIESSYFVHLEDDWLLVKNIDFSQIFTLMEKNADIFSVRFFLSKNKKLKHDDKHVYSNGFSLNPSIIRTSFAKLLLECFNINKNPEKQFTDYRDSHPNSFIVLGTLSDENYIIDMGKSGKNE